MRRRSLSQPATHATKSATSTKPMNGAGGTLNASQRTPMVAAQSATQSASPTTEDFSVFKGPEYSRSGSR